MAGVYGRVGFSVLDTMPLWHDSVVLGEILRVPRPASVDSRLS